MSAKNQTSSKEAVATAGTILLENTREHDITINLLSDNGVVQTTIPGARQNPNSRNELIHGVAEIDGSLVEAARKEFPVVDFYFTEGWLRTATEKAIADQEKLEQK